MSSRSQDFPRLSAIILAYGLCLDHSLKWLVEPQIQCPYSEQKRWAGTVNDNYECPLCYHLFEKFSWNTTQLFLDTTIYKEGREISIFK